jgi:hypothetical protein
MRNRLILALIFAASLAGCEASTETPAKPATTAAEATPSGGPSHSPAVDQTDGKLSLDKLSFTVPEGWQSKPASSSFVLAEFVLSKAEGDDADGRLTVSVAGGTIEANIDRWRDQFGGKPEQASEEQKEINGLKVSLVDFAGEFNDQRGPFAPATKRAGYRMLAAVIPVDGELHFIKATGPRATIAAHADRFQQFIGSVERKK